MYMITLTELFDFECEVRSFFAYGINLQELYLVPSVVDDKRSALIPTKQCMPM